MLPANFNLDVYRGDTRRWKFKLWTDRQKTVPADLTGVVANATIRDKATNGTYMLALVCTVTLPNIIDMVLAADQSRTLPITGGVWDLQLTYPSADIVTPIRGVVTLTQDVTYSQVMKIR